MAYNGSGTFVPLTAPNFPAVDGNVIVAAYYNAVIADLISGLNKALCRDGQAVPTANLPMGGFKLSGLSAGSAGGDSVEFTQFTASVTEVTNQIVALLANLNVSSSAVLPANTNIGDISPAELLSLDGVAGNIELLFAKLNSPAFTGIPTAPTAGSTTNTDQIATMAAVQAVAMNSSLPLQAGNAGKFLSTNGVDGFWADAKNTIPTVPRASNTKIIAADNGQLIDITSGTFAQTIDTAADLGATFYCYIKNSGTGDITFTPTSGTIDGLASYKIYPKEMRLVISDGTTIKTVVMKSFERTYLTNATFVKPPGYSNISYGMMPGGSGGGGGGGGGASAGIGGGGGGGGASGNCGFITSGFVASSYLAATGAIVIGAGGAGGAGGALGNNGELGSVGGATSFYSITTGTTTPTTSQRGKAGVSAGGGGAGGAGGTVGKTDVSGTGFGVVNYTQQNTNEGSGTAGGAASGATGGTGGAGRVGAGTEYLNPSAGGAGGAGVAATVAGNNGTNGAANTGTGGGGGSGAGGQSAGAIGTGLGGTGGAGGSGILILQGGI